MGAIPEIPDPIWDRLKTDVQRSKGQVEDPPPPKASEVTRALNDQQKRVATTYVRTGGNIHEAVRAGGYDTPPPQAFARLEQVHAFRVYVALLFEHVAKKRAEIRARRMKKQQKVVAAAAERIEATGGLAEPVAGLAQVPEGEKPEQFLKVASDIAECLEQARSVVRAKLGDFLDVEPDGRWSVDIDAVKAAGPGIVKTITRDKFGETSITLADHAEARRFLMEYETTKNSNGREANRGDTRTLMLNLVMGDNATFDQVDAAARAIGDQLRTLREEEAKAVTAKKSALQLKPLAAESAPVQVEDKG